jgi:anti-sigma regulatory factor (Ser/Thr protein kinase)
MEGYLALMIPIIAMCIPIIAIWTKHQQKIIEMQVGATAENTAEKAAQYATHIQRLEDRVQVLERIVTDRGYDIATQIEALRDQRRVDEGVYEGTGVPLGLAKKERV